MLVPSERALNRQRRFVVLRFSSKREPTLAGHCISEVAYPARPNKFIFGCLQKVV